MKKLARGKVSGTVLLGVLFLAAGCGSREEDSPPNYIVNKVQTGTTAGEPRADAGLTGEVKVSPTGALSIIQEDIAGEAGKETVSNKETETKTGGSKRENQNGIGKPGADGKSTGETGSTQANGESKAGIGGAVTDVESTNETGSAGANGGSTIGTGNDGTDGTADNEEEELYVTGAADSLEEHMEAGFALTDGVYGNSDKNRKDETPEGSDKTEEIILEQMKEEIIGKSVQTASIGEIRLLEAGAAVDISMFSAQQTAACFSFEELPDAVFEQMRGNSYGEDCIPLSELRYVRVLHYGFDGVVHVGELVVNQSIAQDIRDIFLELFDVQYPIEKILLVDTYGGDDRASMSDNNTFAFHYRPAEGASSLSKHALGLAVDINPLYNPYIPEREGVPEVLPENAVPYTDRQTSCEYYIKHGDPCYEAFVCRGFTWGGDQVSGKDYQHFSKAVQ